MFQANLFQAKCGKTFILYCSRSGHKGSRPGLALRKVLFPEIKIPLYAEIINGIKVYIRFAFYGEAHRKVDTGF